MPGIKIAVFISGSGTNLQSLIDHIGSGKIDGEIDLVVSNKRDAFGLRRAEENGIDTLVLETENYKNRLEKEIKLLKILEEREIGLIVLAGYLEVLSELFIDKYKNRIINVHPSLIPSFSGEGYYGRRIHIEALKRGVKVTGATVHFVDKVVDGGPIIIQDTVKINKDDQLEEVQEKVLELEHRILPEAVRLFSEGKLEIKGNRVVVG